MGSCHSSPEDLVKISDIFRRRHQRRHRNTLNRDQNPSMVFSHPIEDPPLNLASDADGLMDVDEGKDFVMDSDIDADDDNDVDNDADADDPMATDDSISDNSQESSSDSGAHSESSRVIEEYPEAAQTYGPGPTYMESFYADPYSEERKTTSNIYYPFASKGEWELAAFLMRSNLSMSAIDEFLSLRLVVSNHPQFGWISDKYLLI